MAPIRIALVGYGYAGRTFHAPLVDAVDGLGLTAIVSSDPERVARDRPAIPVRTIDDVAADTDIDVAIIATPTDTHAALAMRLLQAGKHVVVDKPFATSMTEADAICAAARRAGRVATAFHNRRWDADFLTVRRLIADGALGTIATFESRFDRFRPVVQDRWRERAGAGSGTWMDLGSHLVDQALVLFGEPDAIAADLASQRSGPAVDYFHVTLRYGTTRVLLRGSSLAAAPGARFAVFGTRASYVKFGLDTQEAALVAGRRPGEPGWGVDPHPGELTEPGPDGSTTRQVPNLAGDYRMFYAGLRDALQHGASPPVTMAEARRVVHILECAVRSSEQRREWAP
ncbi:MAG: oxidoreductase [Vicinamibacterales bacterium]